MSIPTFTVVPSSLRPLTFSADMDQLLSELNPWTEALNAKGSAFALGVSATSTTVLALATGVKTLTVQSGKGFTPGMDIVIASTATPTDRMLCTVSSYDAATGALLADAYSSTGTGSASAWAISMTAAVPAQASIDGIVKSSGTTRTTAVAGVDYVEPGGELGTPSSGNLSSCTADGTNPVGFRNIPQTSKSAAYTLVLADAGKHILHPSADTTARTVTIPANSSVPYPIGTAITFINQNGAGVLTIAITTDVMRLAGAGTTGSRTLAANGAATAVKIAATEWIISGGGLT